jgi:hypothetical protein
MGPPDHGDTPAGVGCGVDVVDLERDHRVAGRRRRDRTGSQPDHEVFAVKPIVDRKDVRERAMGEHQSTHRLGGKEGQAGGAVQRLEHPMVSRSVYVRITHV